MNGLDALIDTLAAACGIRNTYTDAFGRVVDIDQVTKRALLAGLGLKANTESAARESLLRWERRSAAAFPPVVAVAAEQPLRLELGPGRPGRVAAWRLSEENGDTHEGMTSGDGGTLQLRPLPSGYHHLQIGDETTWLISAPGRCWQPDILDSGACLWGASAQVYGLRSQSDLGIGSYSDVAAAAGKVAAVGGSFLGLSPVHALFGSDRSKFSPYSPSSRLFLEPIYIDPTRVPGFETTDAARFVDDPSSIERLEQLRSANLVDYTAVWNLKRPILDVLWGSFKTNGGDADFQAFRHLGGEALEAHATFEALSEVLQSQGHLGMGAWPERFRRLDSKAVRDFQQEQAERVSFHAWLQWLSDRQLAQAADLARASGMPIGLYRDLAVGADSFGSEIWRAPERYATALSIGAPPDPLGPQGQDWGLPPFNPLTLQADGLRAFRELVAANMRHAGAVRIDHAFQLRRLFLIPSGAPASQGAYVDYPFDAMLAVLRIESHRARCLVIAEDLGTAPEGFSDAIMASGAMSYRVLPFERDGARFKRPADYPRSALAVITTHDLPTFVGWWRGLDVDLRRTLGLFDAATAQRERTNRDSDRRHFSQALADEHLLPDASPPAQAPIEAAVRYLARTPSALAALQLDDAFGEPSQANLPGPDVGHPNWRRRLPATLEELTAPGSLFSKLAVAFTEEGRNRRPRKSALSSPPPTATYRLQFHQDFTFDDAAKIIPYLARLGISHVYASPIQKARAGSTHGYDIVDHALLNPELGGEEGFHRLACEIKAHGLRLLVDIVPNHMGVGGQDNAWWLSVLEWGRLSPVADAFDIDWDRRDAGGKLIVPFLGSPYGSSLESGALKLTIDEATGSFSVFHWEHRFPICPITYDRILGCALPGLNDSLARCELARLANRFGALRKDALAGRRQTLHAKAAKLKARLAAAIAASPDTRDQIARAVTLINGEIGLPESFVKLHEILEEQAYRLAHWRLASSQINYRRFFDIDTLAGLRVEVPAIFEQTHALLGGLIDKGLVHGLRIDHIDGLADPESYVRSLQRRFGPGFYVVVEKILEPGEKLRPWPVAGTTGYDVLNLIDGVLVDHRSGAALERLYRDASGLDGPYETLLKGAKRELLEKSFESELEGLVADLQDVSRAALHARDFTAANLRRALVEIVAAFPTYRSYVGDDPPSPEDVELIRSTVDEALESNIGAEASVYRFVASTLLRENGEGNEDSRSPGSRRFRRRFQQLTGPVMAKSLEDTLFYRYGRLIALNEVGGDPNRFGVTPAEFHAANAERAETWPHTMIATSTHDTKRGEDARARLIAISEMPEAWSAALSQWREVVASHSGTEQAGALDANDLVILLQALLGAWPPELLDASDTLTLASFQQRMEAYCTKALREAKRHSNWTDPNESYEQTMQDLLRSLLGEGSLFVDEFRPFARRLAFLGMLNGLSRTVLKATIPGVPDTYQGTEFWDYSLVDPDNRRSVDYVSRSRALDAEPSLRVMLDQWHDGRIKQYVLSRLLKDRAQTPDLYAYGDYQPLIVQGLQLRRLIAFARDNHHDTLVVVVPRLWNGLTAREALHLDRGVWGDTRIAVPKGRWRELLSGAEITVETDETAVGDVLGDLPLAVLKRVALS